MTALTGSDRGRKYWSDLKIKMIEKEGYSELSDEIGQLPNARCGRQTVSNGRRDCRNGPADNSVNLIPASGAP